MHTSKPQPQILRSVEYGRGSIGWSTTTPSQRALTMDVYLPADVHCDGSDLRPALVMAFGGAFHRGTKEDDSFEAEGGNTAIAEYCLRFAQRGYVTASIDYRLIQEDPAPGETQVIMSPQDIPVSRVSYVRQLMGLPPATSDMLWRGIEAASDDMAAAIAFIHSQAKRWHIDPQRIATGGFSAGARTALNAAFGERSDVAAVIALSGFMDLNDVGHHFDHPQGRKVPAVLLINGSKDLDYIVQNAGPLVTALRANGVDCQHATVADAGHFYLAHAEACSDQPVLCKTVEQTIADFLQERLTPSART